MHVMYPLRTNADVLYYQEPFLASALLKTSGACIIGIQNKSGLSLYFVGQGDNCMSLLLRPIHINHWYRVVSSVVI